MSEYNFDALGWYQFERLCQALLRATLGAALEAWGGSGDLGRDAYARGPLRFPEPDHLEDGPFLFQVKHVSDARAIGKRADRALLGAVKAEALRIQQRIAQKLWEPPRFYTLLTNVALRPATRTAVEEQLRSTLPYAVVLASGAREVAAMLDAQPGVRVSYPQVLGLGDLQELIANAVAKDVIERSRFSMAAAIELAPVFVPTEAYNRALAVLAKEGFAVLLSDVSKRKAMDDLRAMDPIKFEKWVAQRFREMGYSVKTTQPLATMAST